jgi:hypothetical protein
MRKRLYEKVKHKSRKLFSSYEMIGPFAVISDYKFFTNIHKRDLLDSDTKKYLNKNEFKIIPVATDYKNSRLPENIIAVYRKCAGYNPPLKELEQSLYKNIHSMILEDYLMDPSRAVVTDVEIRAKEIYERSMFTNKHSPVRGGYNDSGFFRV